MIYAILATAFFFLPKEYRAVETEKAASAMERREAIFGGVAVKSSGSYLLLSKGNC